MAKTASATALMAARIRSRTSRVRAADDIGLMYTNLLRFPDEQHIRFELMCWRHKSLYPTS